MLVGLRAHDGHWPRAIRRGRRHRGGLPGVYDDLPVRPVMDTEPDETPQRQALAPAPLASKVPCAIVVITERMA